MKNKKLVKKETWKKTIGYKYQYTVKRDPKAGCNQLQFEC